MMILRIESRSRFLDLVTITFWARYFSVMGSCPVHYRTFSSIPGLYPGILAGANKSVSDFANCLPGVGEWCKIAPG